MIKIDVDDYYIRCGKPMCLEGCPVALAMVPRLPAGVFPLVLDDEVHIRVRDLPKSQQKASERVIKLPPEVKARILEYDKTGKMTPFSFEIDL